MTDVAHRPAVTVEDASTVAKTLFGVRARATELPSERDRNFALRTDDGERLVLKIANAAEGVATLECQNAVLQHLEATLPADLAARVPRVHAATDGTTITRHERHLVRLLSHVPGTPLATFAPHRAPLRAALGAMMAQVDLALADFDHPCLHEPFAWNLCDAAATIARHADVATDPRQRDLVRWFLTGFEAETVPVLGDLPTGAIHGDANDYNVMVEARGPAAEPVPGLIDFGDMVHSYTVADLAVAIAYAMLHDRDPLRAAREVTRGYHAVRPLTPAEADAVYGLVTARLCVSATLAAEQHAAAPDNDYLLISQKPIAATLARLRDVHPRLGRAALRDACGMAPWPATAPVTTWLRDHSDTLAPVVDGDPGAVFDLSMGSTTLGHASILDDVEAFTALLFGRMNAADTRVGIGRWNEARPIYTTEAFAGEDANAERRTVHLGVDLFAAAGTPVMAPVDGTVLSVADNDAPGDYGPTVILEHRVDDDLTFWTLYGHLDPDLLDTLRPGDTVRAGEAFAQIGAPPRNGNWPPHVHLQVIVDRLDLSGDFPGVAAPGHRGVWLGLCPDPSPLIGRDCAAAQPTGDALQAARRTALGPSLSVSYRRPLHIVRGEGAWLFDADGRRYLDGVNNVCHVGHAHPRVVRALAAQAAVLNTNTRYLHDNITRFAERLTALFPDPLSVCFLVCSGSEANELALRLARTHTGRRDVVVLEGGYHGNTSSLVDLSSYKHDGPGGHGAPDWVHTVPLPDPFRGRHRGDDSGIGGRYADHVRETIAALAGDHAPAAFLAEALPGCGGQIVPPPDWLRLSFQHARAAGAVCIADEVQTGFGRVGSHRWAFELDGVVPDIVTLGKPIGNGHPLAAVITTPEIAASFDNGMEYFNTFGGNPVSCAVGLAVLDAIEEMGLQAHAATVGDHLLGRLRALQAACPLVGDVRGAGLFIGVELVVDQGSETLLPAPDHAAYAVERMVEHGILLSTDGPDHNVLKIKPPLVFSLADADRLVDTLTAVLDEQPLRAS